LGGLHWPGLVELPLHPAIVSVVNAAQITATAVPRIVISLLVAIEALGDFTLRSLRAQRGRDASSTSNHG
jgi:hypothetical protein